MNQQDSQLIQQLASSVASLSDRLRRVRIPPAVVLTELAAGRRELGWEVGYLSQANANATASPVIGITVNNDADFVAVKPTLYQTGVAGAGIPVPPSVTLQIRDSATGNVFMRQPGAASGFLCQPYNPGSPYSSGRFVRAAKGWPAPHILKRGSSVFFEVSNPTGYEFVGDLNLVYEGSRFYAGQTEPIPKSIQGQVEPFCWNGTLVVPNGLDAGLQNLGNIVMPGLDQNRYVLTEGAIIATGTPAAVGGVQMFPEDVLLMQVQDTYQQGKLWARVSTPPAYGQFMPAKAFVGGGIGAPWAWPRFVQGTDTITVTLYGDPSAWEDSEPGTIEVQLHGVRIYG